MHRVSLPCAGLTAIWMFGCMPATRDDSSALHLSDRPAPQSRTSAGQTAVASPSLIPKQVYRKDGATNEEFQRTRARCLMQAEIAESASNDPNGWSRAGTWMMVYRTCMRAEGWVLVKQ